MIAPFRKRVYGYECDLYGHLHNTNYLNILEAARSEALVDVGMPVKRLLELDWHVYINKVEVEFIKGVEVDEIIEVCSEIYDRNKLRSSWNQEIFNEAGDLCFRAQIHVVHVHKGKPARVPEHIWEHFQKLGE
jgi:YbgC/YbaW family acyl-CoA thioester hydrolase